MDHTARRPRLTNGILDDLKELLSVADDEISYLADALEHHRSHVGLFERLGDKHYSLTRSRDWLARRIDAERTIRDERRGAGTDSIPSITEGGPA